VRGVRGGSSGFPLLYILLLYTNFNLCMFCVFLFGSSLIQNICFILLEISTTNFPSFTLDHTFLYLYISSYPYNNTLSVLFFI